MTQPDYPDHHARVITPAGRTLRLIHVASTAWFLLCMLYILTLELRQAGVKWWVIFSLSGHSAVIVLLLISLYLFAIFRGIGRNQEVQQEHPLTSTRYYTVLYIISPFLGAIAGCIGLIGEEKISQVLLDVAIATLAATCLVWVIIEPATELFELLLPASRKHRHERLAKARALHEKRQQQRQQLLDDVLAKAEADQNHWQQVLMPQAQQLAELLSAETIDTQTEGKAVEMGVSAWRMGGLACMRQLHKMAIQLRLKNADYIPCADYISFWWDGIGNWRNSNVQA